MDPTPRFLQAIATFEGRGLDDYFPIDPPLSYTVPENASAQCVYFRAGNSSDELACIVLLRDDRPMRLFPVGARQAIHFPLRVTEDLLSETRLDVHISAPDGVRGTVVVDLGILEL